MARHGFNTAYWNPVDNNSPKKGSLTIDQTNVAVQTERVADEVSPPKRPRAKETVTAVQPPVPSEEFVRRISDLARRAFPAAPPVSSTAPVPKSDHVDLLALELWASGSLPDVRFLGRWEPHIATCAKCTARLSAADARRRSG